MRTNKLTLIALGLLAATPLAAQQTGNYPSRAIRFILPFPPGGGTDIVGRVLAQRLAEEVGQAVIPDNRAGAGGNIGAEIVAKAAPDGYTIVMATVSLAVSPTLYKKLNYDPQKDLAPIGLVAASPNTLAVHLARSQDGRVSFGTGGPGSLNDLISQVFRSISNGKSLVVPYKGINPATIAMLSGEVDAAVISVASAAQYVNAGKLRALATLAPERSALLPKVPTSKEAGYPELEAVLWYGMLAPAATPPAIITRLNQAFTKISNAADTRERLASVGTLPMTSTPEQFAEFLKKDIARWGKVVRDSGATAE